MAGFLVEFRAQVLLRLVVLSGGDDDGIFHRAHDDVRIDAFFTAQSIDHVVQFTCHKTPATLAAYSYRLAAQVKLEFGDQIGLLNVGQFNFDLRSGF